MNHKDAHGNAKLTWEDVREIVSLRGFRSAAEVAREFRVGKSTVQYDMTGRPFNCWKLAGAAIVNEPRSDGIYWRDPDPRSPRPHLGLVQPCTGRGQAIRRSRRAHRNRRDEVLLRALPRQPIVVAQE